MRKVALCLVTALLTNPIIAEQTPREASRNYSSFTPFTGKVTKNRVRLRAKPDLEGSIIRELNSGEILAIVNEEDDFYAVKPSKDAKAYVFRTYILDNTVEGNHVNVRLEPDLQSPVITQLNHGDKISGSISGINNKWIEITPPDDVVFYISKDYIANIGDANLIKNIERRRKEACDLIDNANMVSQAELKKPFPEIKLNEAMNDLNRVAKEYADFPEQAKRATYYLSQVREAYLQKKIEYLEEQSNATASGFKNRCQELTEKMHHEQEKINLIEKNLEAVMSGEDVNPSSLNLPEKKEILVAEASSEQLEAKEETIHWVSNPKTLPSAMNHWEPKENMYFENWLAKHPGGTLDDFYSDENNNSVTMRGIIQPYSRNVKNKPGNYILIDPVDKMPIAFIYSTRIDLQRQVGKTVRVVGSSRPNNHFAFPAYYVLNVQ